MCKKEDFKEQMASQWNIEKDSNYTLKAIGRELMYNIDIHTKFCDKHNIHISYFKIQYKPYDINHLDCFVIGEDLKPLCSFEVSIENIEIRTDVIFISLKDWINREYGNSFECTFPRTSLDRKSLILEKL